MCELKGEIRMFINLEGTYYNKEHIVSVDKTENKLEVEFINGKILNLLYDNTELAMEDYKEIILKGDFVCLNGKYYNRKMILIAEVTGKEITLEFLSGKIAIIKYHGFVMAHREFQNIMKRADIKKYFEYILEEHFKGKK